MTVDADGTRPPGGEAASRAAAAEDVRRRILSAAGEQFRESGYERASLHDIGGQVGLTRGAVLYHFGSKAELMTALLQPFIAQLDADLDAFEADERIAKPARVLGALLDALSVNRPAAELLARDVSGRQALDLDNWFTATVERLVRLLCHGRTDDPAARVRALSALGAIVRPLVSLPDDEVQSHRDVVLTAALNTLRRTRR